MDGMFFGTLAGVDVVVSSSGCLLVALAGVMLTGCFARWASWISSLLLQMSEHLNLVPWVASGSSFNLILIAGLEELALLLH